MRIIWKAIIGEIYNLMQWMAVCFVVFVGTVSAYEYYLTFDDLLTYYTVIPVSDSFDSGEPIQFYSFMQSHKKADVDWNESVHCASNGNGFIHFDTDNSSKSDFYRSEDLSSEIFGLLLDIKNRGLTPSNEQVNILREYADDSHGIKEWVLHIEEPEIGSICVATHTITAKTKYLKFEKRNTIVSKPWSYGIE